MMMTPIHMIRAATVLPRILPPIYETLNWLYSNDLGPYVIERSFNAKCQREEFLDPMGD